MNPYYAVKKCVYYVYYYPTVKFANFSTLTAMQLRCAVVGFVAGSLYGGWDSAREFDNDGSYWTIGPVSKDIRRSRAQTIMTGSMFGGACGLYAGLLAPVWVPAAGIGYVVHAISLSQKHTNRT